MNNNIQIRSSESVETTRETPKRSFTIKHKLNLSKSMKGRKAWNKGLTKDDPRVARYTQTRINNPDYELYKQKLSIVNMGHKSTFNRKHTREEIQKIKDKQIGRIHNYKVWNKDLNTKNSKKVKDIGRKISFTLKNNLSVEERSIIGRNARSKVIPYKISKGEKYISLKIKENGIDFIPQYKIQTDKILTYVDIFIPKKICIYIDGIYWHNRPEVIKRDNAINIELKNLGYLIKRYILNNNEDEIVKEIILDDDIVRYSK